MTCYNSITVNAAPETVWAVLREFHDMSWADGIVENVAPVGDLPADANGTGRLINGVIRETLTGLDDADMTLSYSLDDGPDVLAADRVQNYRATLRVRPVTATGQSFVEWHTTWDAADGDVKSFCDPLYAGMLNQLASRYA